MRASVLLVAGLWLLSPGLATAQGSPAPSGVAREGTTGATSEKKVAKKRPKRKRGAPARASSGASGGTTTSLGGKTPELKTLPAGPALSPFPGSADAVAKAFAENRRERLADAERAARGPKVADRWNTVLFHVKELDSRSDREACFWRTVAFYRLGEVGHGDATRDLCEFPASDYSALEAERNLSISLQPPALLPELKASGLLQPTLEPGSQTKGAVRNPDAYGGRSPTTVVR
jgi:hypothetical protein